MAFDRRSLDANRLDYDIGRRILPVKGLVTNVNESLLEGHIRYSRGVVMRRAGILEPRRQYYCIDTNTSIPWTGFANIYVCCVFGYGTTLYSIADNGQTLQFGITGQWGSGFTDAMLPASGLVGPLSNDYLRTTETSGNLYAALSQGVFKIASTTATAWTRASAPRALDPTLTGTSSSSGFLTNNTAVAYRVVWGYVDVNRNLILGWPSGNVALYNTSGGAQNVTVKAFIPSSIKVNANAGVWNLYVYRTDISTVGAGLSTIPSPGDVCRLVYQYSFTTTDVANGYVQFTDVFPEGVNKGPDLYTNTNQGGIEGANAPLPFCYDLAIYREVHFFARTNHQDRLTQQLLGIPTEMVVSTGAGGFTKSGGNVVVTFTGSPDLTGIDSTMKLAISAATSAGNVGTFPIVSVNVGAFTITATNAGAVTEAGAVNSRGIAAKITCAGQSYHAIYAAESVANRYFQVTTTGSSQQNVALTASSLVRIINQDASQVVNAFNISGPDDPAGLLQFEGPTAFSSPSAFTFQTIGQDFGLNKWLPAAYVAVSSNSDTSESRLYYSKTGEPEHVPLNNYFDIGAKNKSIRRILANRDSLFIFKDDGVFRLNGDPNAGAVPTRFDDTLVIIAPNGATLLRNEIYVATNKGVAAVSDAGVRFVSGAISNIFSKLYDSTLRLSQIGGTAVTCHMLSSERDGMLYFYAAVAVDALTMGQLSDPAGAHQYVRYVVELQYNVTTGAWTGREDLGGTASSGAYFLDAYPLSPTTWPGTVVNGILYRHPVYGSGSVTGSQVGVFREVDVNIADTTTIGEQALGQAPVGDRTPITISAGAGTTSLTLTAKRTELNTPAINDLLLYKGALALITGVSGSGPWTATISPVHGAVLGDFSNDLAQLLRPDASRVEWQPISGGQDQYLNQFGEVTLIMETPSTITAPALGFYSEISASTETVTASASSALRAFRTLVPSLKQTARRLYVIFTTSEGGVVWSIDSLAYVAQRFARPRTVE